MLDILSYLGRWHEKETLLYCIMSKQARLLPSVKIHMYLRVGSARGAFPGDRSYEKNVSCFGCWLG